MLPAPNRLRHRADFTAAVRGHGGTRAGSPLLVIHAIRTDARAGLPPRVGFVVSKAVGGAVLRTRVKRRLRAVVAARLSALPQGADIVVRANSAAATASSKDLAMSLDPLWHRVIGRLGRVS